jgi:phosphopantothenoylcysteine decarboxylase/phosphopantothenate--cysteine ligase
MNVMAKNVMAEEPFAATMSGPRILLVIGGGIAAYKSCELVRLIRKGGGEVTCVLTDGGAQFVTAMSLAALSGNQVHSTLWDLKNEAEIGHIELSRAADLVVVCPATADLLAKMAAGIADDLGTTLILATDKPVLAVPAMNVKMWEHEATQRNVKWLRKAGVRVMQPDEGEMACGEFGPGRLPEPEAVWLEIADALGIDPGDARSEEIGAFLRAQAEADYVDPEEDGEAVVEEAARPAKTGGLGSLIASIIPRSTLRKVQEEEVVYSGMDAEAGALAASGAVPVLAKKGKASGAPMLAVKGKAAAAPPTDTEAINHEIDPRRLPPEEDAVLADPLGGQPDFDVEPEHRPLYGKHVLVTAGPTHEAIDPVRFIANRSSGKQGFAIAAAAANAGAKVTLIAGPVALDTPPGVERIDVESAAEMAKEVKAALPADVAVMVAAVSDWRTKEYKSEKIKKRGSAPPALVLTENPDILANLAGGSKRPKLVIGFAAETEKVIEHATKKRKNKGADWIIANDVSEKPDGSVMGSDRNEVHLVREKQVDSWDPMSKEEVARKLVERIADALEESGGNGKR